MAALTNFNEIPHYVMIGKYLKIAYTDRTGLRCSYRQKFKRNKRRRERDKETEGERERETEENDTRRNKKENKIELKRTPYGRKKHTHLGCQHISQLPKLTLWFHMSGSN